MENKKNDIRILGKTKFIECISRWMTFNERFFKEIYQTTDVVKWWLPIDVVKLR